MTSAESVEAADLRLRGPRGPAARRRAAVSPARAAARGAEQVERGVEAAAGIEARGGYALGDREQRVLLASVQSYGPAGDERVGGSSPFVLGALHAHDARRLVELEDLGRPAVLVASAALPSLMSCSG